MKEFDNNFAIIRNDSNQDGNVLSDNIDTLSISDEQISFINCSNDYCVCFIDIVDSTINTNKIIESERIRDYYSLFLNTMSSIIKSYQGRVIKNSGDSLLYYFPNTDEINDELAFQNVFECGLSMIAINANLNLALKRYNLPSISYRISANYGRVELAISSNSNDVDLFGPAVNICSKINQLAKSNQMVIHSNLHEIVKRQIFYKDYVFKSLVKEKENTIIIPEIYSICRTEDKNKQKEIINRIEKKIIENRLNKQNVHNSFFNILIIDDDEDILYTFDSIIRDKGYNVTCISNPSEVLSHLLDKHPHFYHLVIMDIRMPKINGIKLYSKIKVINPEVKVLFISALSAIDEILSIFPEIGFSEIMHKPIDSITLISKIDMVLRN